MEKTNAERRGDLVARLVNRGMQADLASELRSALEGWLPHPLVDHDEAEANEQAETPAGTTPENEYEATRQRKEEEQAARHANRMDLREIARRNR